MGQVIHSTYLNPSKAMQKEKKRKKQELTENQKQNLVLRLSVFSSYYVLWGNDSSSELLKQKAEDI